MTQEAIHFSEERSEEAVISRMDPGKVDPRLFQVMGSLVKHLHAFIKEAEPTNDEWMAGIQFLTRTGHMCTDWRQEFILLSDTLGVSMLVESLKNHKMSGETESTVLGPFYVKDAPHYPNGANICLDGKGPPVWVEGRVTDASDVRASGPSQSWPCSGWQLHCLPPPHAPTTRTRARRRSRPSCSCTATGRTVRAGTPS